MPATTANNNNGSSRKSTYQYPAHDPVEPHPSRRFYEDDDERTRRRDQERQMEIIKAIDALPPPDEFDVPDSGNEPDAFVGQFERSKDVLRDKDERVPNGYERHGFDADDISSIGSDDMLSFHGTRMIRRQDNGNGKAIVGERDANQWNGRDGDDTDVLLSQALFAPSDDGSAGGRGENYSVAQKGQRDEQTTPRYETSVRRQKNGYTTFDSISMPSSPSSLDRTASFPVSKSRLHYSSKNVSRNSFSEPRRRSFSASGATQRTVDSNQDIIPTLARQNDSSGQQQQQLNSVHNQNGDSRYTSTHRSPSHLVPSIRMNDDYESHYRKHNDSSVRHGGEHIPNARNNMNMNSMPHSPPLEDSPDHQGNDDDDMYYLDNEIYYPGQHTPQKLEPPLYIGADPSRLKAYISAVHINLRAAQEKVKSVELREQKLLERCASAEQQKSDLERRCSFMKEQLAISQGHGNDNNKTDQLTKRHQLEVDNLAIVLSTARGRIIELEHEVEKEGDEKKTLRKAFSEQHDQDMTQLSDCDILIRSLKKEIARYKENSTSGIGSPTASVIGSPQRRESLQQIERQLRHQHQHELGQIRKQFEKRQKEVQEQQGTALRQLKENHHQSNLALKREHDETLQRMAGEHKEREKQLSNRIDELNGACATLKEHISRPKVPAAAQTDDRIQKKTTTSRSVTTQSHMSSSGISALEDAVKTLQEELNARTNNNSEHVQEMELKYHELNQNAIKYQEQNAEIKHKYRDLHAQYKRLRQSRNQIEEETERLRHQRAEESETYQTRLRDLQGELQEFKNSVSMLQQECDTLRESHKSAEEQLSRNVSQLEDLQISKERLIRENEALIKRYDELDSQLRESRHELGQENDALKMQLNTVRQTCNQEIDKARRKYQEEKETAIAEACERMILECESQVEKMQRHIERLEEDLSSERAQRANDTQELHRIHDRHGTLRNEYNDLQRSYEEMRRSMDKLDRYRNMIHQLKERLAKRKRDIEKLTDRYENKLADVETQLHNLQAVNTQFNQTMSLKDVQVQSLNRQIKQYQQHLKNHASPSQTSLSRSLFSISSNEQGDSGTDNIYSQNLNSSLLSRQQQKQRLSMTRNSNDENRSRSIPSNTTRDPSLS